MTEQVIVHDISEIEKYRQVIQDNLNKSALQLKELISSSSAIEIFQVMKYNKSVTEPLTGEPENLVEVINQSMTYWVSIMSVEYLFQKYPEKSFVLNWGNIPGYDIESVDGEVIGECFAATSYSSNQKLTKDLKRLVGNNSAKYKYEFFYDKEFTENHKRYYKEKYPEIEIVKFHKIH